MAVNGFISRGTAGEELSGTRVSFTGDRCEPGRGPLAHARMVPAHEDGDGHQQRTLAFGAARTTRPLSPRRAARQDLHLGLPARSRSVQCSALTHPGPLAYTPPPSAAIPPSPRAQRPP